MVRAVMLKMPTLELQQCRRLLMSECWRGTCDVRFKVLNDITMDKDTEREGDRKQKTNKQKHVRRESCLSDEVMQFFNLSNE